MVGAAAVLGLMFVAVWIVPLLRRLDLMSVFSYLEKRFHPAIRMLASALCIAMQIGSRMSVILFLPALAIATITGVDVVWSILIMAARTMDTERPAVIRGSRAIEREIAKSARPPPFLGISAIPVLTSDSP